jgi:hypothetical protein
MERSAETTRDDPDGEYLKRNRWFESGSLQRRVRLSPASAFEVQNPGFPRGCARLAWRKAVSDPGRSVPPSSAKKRLMRRRARL